MGLERWLTSVGMIIAATALVPMIKSASEPVLSKGRTGAGLARDEARKRLSFLQEEWEDFLAEVEFERSVLNQQSKSNA